MRINIKELIPIQKEVDEKVVERLGREPGMEERILALNVELFEYFNAVGTWKWWKHNHVIDREKILDELADCFAFFLSMIIFSDKHNLVKIEEVNHLIKFSSKSKMLTTYEDELFENYVDRIIVYSREEIGFELKCGITLRERMVN